MSTVILRATSMAPELVAAAAVLLASLVVSGCLGHQDQRDPWGPPPRTTTAPSSPRSGGPDVPAGPDRAQGPAPSAPGVFRAGSDEAAQPVLTLVKSAPATARRCDTITLVYTVTNSGTVSAGDVVITDALTEGLTTADGSPAVRIEVGSIPPGEVRRFEVPATAARIGVLGSPAAVSSGSVRAPAEAVTTVVTEPRLTLGGSCEKPGVHVYTLRNSGNGPAVAATVRVNLPEGATEPWASDGGAVRDGVAAWELGELTAGESRTLTVGFKFERQRLGETRAEASAECAETVRADCNG